VTNAFRRALGAGAEAGRRIGFVLLLAGGSAGLGLLISWPLWLFATTAKQAYTFTLLALAAAGTVFMVVRAAQRSRKAARDPARPPRPFLSALITVLMAVEGITGAYLAVVLLVRGIWIFGAAEIALWAALLWLMGRARAAARKRKARPVPAENGSE
jgi:hypothetical protein